MRTLVDVLLILSGCYVLGGAIFLFPFLRAGMYRLNAQARGGTWGFRMIIIPGIIVLWPWLGWRWWRGDVPVERTAHRLLAGEGRNGQ